jgi:uncharacterized protein YbjT (DUF2867 family)
MKIVVIGGTGLIGSKLVTRLREMGNAVIAASPNSGVNTLTGEGLADAIAGAEVVVDVSNSPSFADDAVMSFFQTSTRNLLAAEEMAGVRHHVALSVVGTDRLQESGYFRAKLAQENLIKSSPMPYTILRSTQFFEFIGRIAQESADGKSVHVAAAFIQPIVSDDVVEALAELTVGAPGNGTVEVAGPERFHLDDLVRRALKANGDARDVITDADARYFGAVLDEDTLTPAAPGILGTMHFGDWMHYATSRPAAPQQAAAR